MKKLNLVRNSIRSIPLGKPFAMKSINGGKSYTNVRKVVSRLTKSGELMRAARGIYVRPKKVPYLGKVLPGAEEIVKAISKQTGEVIAVHGAEAVSYTHLRAHETRHD